MRRFTRLTNAFTRKVENLAAAVSLHFMYYNFARPHMSLANPYPRTPAMAAGVADHVWKITEMVGLLDGQAQIAKASKISVLDIRQSMDTADNLNALFSRVPSGLQFVGPITMHEVVVRAHQFPLLKASPIDGGT